MTTETRLVNYTYAPENETLNETFGVVQSDLDTLVERIIKNLNEQARENQGAADFSIAFHEGIQGINFGLILVLACKQIGQLLERRDMAGRVESVLRELMKRFGHGPDSEEGK